MMNRKLEQTPFDEQDLIPLIFKSVLEEKPWSSLLNHLRVKFNAKHAAINFRMPQDGMPRPFIMGTQEHNLNFKTNGSMTDAYLDEFYSLDPMYNFDLKPGSVVTFEDIVDRGHFVTSDFYQRFLQPFGLTHGLKMCFEEPRGLRAWLMLSRDESVGNFDNEIKQQCIELLPHLELALEIHSRLMLKETKLNIYSKSMSQLVVGTIIVDGDGEILDINQAAAQIITESHVLEIRSGRLISTHPHISSELTKTLTEVMEASRSQDQLFSLRTMTIETADNHIGILIKSAPHNQWYGGASAPHAIIYLRDPAVSPVTSEMLMGELFSLSPAEARIAIQLALGRSIAETARHLNLNESTVRTQTKRIFSKTGVSRQGELIVLINQSVVRLGGDSEKYEPA